MGFKGFRGFRVSGSEKNSIDGCIPPPPPKNPMLDTRAPPPFALNSQSLQNRRTEDAVENPPSERSLSLTA